jgi:glycosyltransferase involved in cell wall biosynthesis
MEKPVIIHLSSAKTWRGGENQISILMSELARNDWPQLLFVPKQSALEAWAIRYGHEYISYKKTGPISLSAALKLSTICKRMPASILHIHDSHAHNLAYLGAKFLGINSPWILTRRILHNNKKSGFSTAKYNHPSLKHIVAISSAVKNSIYTSIKLTPIHVIPSCIQVNYTDTTFKIKHELGIPEEDRIIGYAAALTPEKDHLTFLKVAKSLLQYESNLSFILLGENTQVSKELIDFLNDNHELSQKVYFTGYRPNPIDFMSQWDICLSTSKTEGLGTSLLECMSLNVPVVSTKNGGIEDWIKNDFNGLLSPVGDVGGLTNQVLKVLNDPALKDTITRNAKQTIDQYGPTQMAAKYMEIYQSMIYLPNSK